MDLAIMAEGLTVVPLYARQAPEELVAMMQDCWPAANLPVANRHWPMPSSRCGPKRRCIFALTMFSPQRAKATVK